MDFANEHYIRIYTRDTTTWARMGWDAQCVLMQILRKMDWSGVLDIESVQPWEAVVIHCRAPEDVAKRGMEKLLELKVLVHNERRGQLVAPKYVEANTASKSDKQRQRESRGLRRALALSRNVTVGHDETDDDDERGDPGEQGSVSQNVTPETGNVTERHDESHAVVSGHTRSLSSSSSSSSSSSAMLCNAVERGDARGLGEEDSDPETDAPLLGKLDAQHVSAEWHRQARAPNGCPSANHPSSLHRDAYETIAASVNLCEDPAAALRAVMAWFWHSADGPVRSGRVKASRAKPAMLAAGITSDLERALGHDDGARTRSTTAEPQRPERKIWKPEVVQDVGGPSPELLATWNARVKARTGIA